MSLEDLERPIPRAGRCSRTRARRRAPGVLPPRRIIAARHWQPRHQQRNSGSRGAILLLEEAPLQSDPRPTTPRACARVVQRAWSEVGVEQEELVEEVVLVLLL